MPVNNIVHKGESQSPANGLGLARVLGPVKGGEDLFLVAHRNGITEVMNDQGDISAMVFQGQRDVLIVTAILNRIRKQVLDDTLESIS